MRQLKDRANPLDLRVAVLRLNGQGEASIGDWVALLSFEQLVALMRQAGYGSE